MSLGLDRLVAGRGAFRVGPIDLEAVPGDLVALVGPNGSGKTTLLRTMAGLNRPVSGGVRIAGRPAWLPPPGETRAGFSTLHLVALGRGARRPWAPSLGPTDYQAARDALDRFDLAALAERPFDALSSGQQQLALIARLWVQEAETCLLDEPTALLDPGRREAVIKAIRALAGEGRVVVVATHDLDLARRADRVVLLEPEPRVGGPELLTPAALARLFPGLA